SSCCCCCCCSIRTARGCWGGRLPSSRCSSNVGGGTGHGDRVSQRLGCLRRPTPTQKRVPCRTSQCLSAARTPRDGDWCISLGHRRTSTRRDGRIFCPLRLPRFILLLLLVSAPARGGEDRHDTLALSSNAPIGFSTNARPVLSAAAGGFGRIGITASFGAAAPVPPLNRIGGGCSGMSCSGRRRRRRRRRRCLPINRRSLQHPPEGERKRPQQRRRHAMSPRVPRQDVRPAVTSAATAPDPPARNRPPRRRPSRNRARRSYVSARRRLQRDRRRRCRRRLGSRSGSDAVAARAAAAVAAERRRWVCRVRGRVSPRDDAARV
ncbi:unnamed protein product, partial [Ectocarpus sp. 8 AP-2014]